MIIVDELRFEMPQYYAVEERVAILKKMINSGWDLYQMARAFGDVGPGTIKYHIDRYITGRTAAQFIKEPPKDAARKRHINKIKGFREDENKYGKWIEGQTF